MSEIQRIPQAPGSNVIHASASLPGKDGAISVCAVHASPEPFSMMGGPGPYGDLPLLDVEVLRDLEQQLEDTAAARSFALDFISIWDERYTRLSAATIAHDEADSLDAALSVKIASTMVGASRLAQLAKDLEEVIRRGDMATAGKALPNLERCGRETIGRLRSYIQANFC